MAKFCLAYSLTFDIDMIYIGFMLPAPETDVPATRGVRLHRQLLRLFQHFRRDSAGVTAASLLLQRVE